MFAEIYSGYTKSQKDFDDAAVYPAEFYCSKTLNIDTIERVIFSPKSNDEVVYFKKLLEQATTLLEVIYTINQYFCVGHINWSDSKE